MDVTTPDPAGRRCARMLVTDTRGIVVAPLDSVDPIPLDVQELCDRLGSSETSSAVTAGSRRDPCVDIVSLVDRLTVHGEDVTLLPRHPIVLRDEGDAVLGWDDARRSYVTCSVDELAVLDRLHWSRDASGLMQELSTSPWSVPERRVAMAVARLVDLGWIDLLPGVEPRADVAVATSSVDDLAVAAPDAPFATVHGPEPASTPSVTAGPMLPAAREGEPTIGRIETPEPGLFEGLPSGAAAVRVVVFRGWVRSRRVVIRRARSAAAVASKSVLRRIEPWSLSDRDHSAGAMTADALRAGEAGHDLTAPADPERSGPGSDVPVEPSGTDVRIGEISEEWEDTGEVGPQESPEPAPHPIDPRVPVFGVYHSPELNANLGLGLIIAHARVVGGGVLNNRYDLRRAQPDPTAMLDELARTGRRAVVLFSDYMWSIDHNLEVTRTVKELNPGSITIHGGPHAPAYPGDAERFLADHPTVDVLVRGEGEQAIAELLSALDESTMPGDLHEVLASVGGLTIRGPQGGGAAVVRTPDRVRAADLDAFPSPYLTGEFAEIDPALWRSATVETNRGCPYGCTFCDWGQATMSRIRHFDLDRVLAELEWIAARGIHEVFLADSNFGMHARDVDIARHIADLKQRYGFPRQVVCSFAKNTVKHTAEIVRIWVEAGICAEGSVALQTTDPVTLRNVDRTNIRVEKYDALADEFRKHRLPIVTDLLMGLPGATVDSFKADLQRCIDQDVTPRMMETVVLPNSPMNDPAYRTRFSIELDPSGVVVSTTSYSRDDFAEMKRLRLLFRALEHFGLLRHLFRWLQAERDITALDLIHEIDRAIVDDPFRYPLLTWVGRYFDLVTAPPGGWPPFYAEIRRLLDERCGLAADPGLDVVLDVQEFLMPRRGRVFPDTLHLRHDYVAWFDQRSTAGQVLRLEEFEPGRLEVDDPQGVCEARIVRNGFSIRRDEACDNPFWVLNDWELGSALARPMATSVPFTAS